MVVSDILKVKGNAIISIGAQDRVAKAVQLLTANRIGAVLVLGERGDIAGIFSERDVVNALHRHGEAALGHAVGELMTTHVVTCSPRDPVAAIMGMMTVQRFRHVPVIDEGRLIGIISIGDVVKSRIEEAEAEAEALRRYIAS
jgi:CBS domain-containing protein